MRNDISNLKKNYALNFKMGMIVALSTALFAFSYTTYEPRDLNPPIIDFPYTDDIDVTPPTSDEPKVTPPPPAAPKLKPLTIIEEDPDPVVPAKFDDKSEEDPNPVKPYTNPKPIKIPVPAIPVIEPDEPEDLGNEIWTSVEQMPMFTNCEGETSALRQQCSDKALLSYIYKNIKYPRVASDNGVEGIAFISFVVNKEGKVVNAKILRDPGAGLGAEALRVVKSMGTWIPGVQSTRKVNVQFNLPVKFKLN